MPRHYGAPPGESAPAALITGGSRGIGAQIVLELAKQGTRTCFTYVSDDRAARDVVQQAMAAGAAPGTVVAVRADACDETAMARAFEIVESLGRFEVLVNNAGRTGRISSFDKGSNEEVHRVVELNLVAPIVASRSAVRLWAGDGRGRCIVNITSAAATLGAPGEYIPYAAAKAGMEAFTVGLAKELGPTGIRVNAVSPGTTQTDIHAAAGEPGRAARVASRIPLGRAAEPVEIAKTAVWLTTSDASYVTGAVLRVAGGL